MVVDRIGNAVVIKLNIHTAEQAEIYKERKCEQNENFKDSKTLKQRPDVKKKRVKAEDQMLKPEQAELPAFGRTGEEGSSHTTH